MSPQHKPHGGAHAWIIHSVDHACHSNGSPQANRETERVLGGVEDPTQLCPTTGQDNTGWEHPRAVDLLELTVDVFKNLLNARLGNVRDKATTHNLFLRCSHLAQIDLFFLLHVVRQAGCMVQFHLLRDFNGSPQTNGDIRGDMIGSNR